MSKKQNNVNANAPKSQKNPIVAISYGHSKFNEIVAVGGSLILDCRETGKSLNPKTTTEAFQKRFGEFYGLVPALAFRKLERHGEWLAHAANAAQAVAKIAKKTPVTLIGWNTAHLKAVAMLVAKADTEVHPILEWEHPDRGPGRSLIESPSDDEFSAQLNKFLPLGAETNAKPMAFSKFAKLLG